MNFPDDVPTLVDGDVTLRAHRLDDVDAVVEQCTDPISIRWTTVPLGYDAEMARSFVGEAVPGGWRDGTEWAFAIESTHPDGRRRFSGTISLRDEGDARAELAFGTHPAVRGRGVVTTAVRLILDWGFEDRGLETILWQAERGNVASRRVAWRAGFSFSGVLPAWLKHRDWHVDAWMATLHRDDQRAPTSAWYDVPVLTGQQVVVRPQRDDDADRIVEGASDETTQYWLPFLGSPFTHDSALRYVRKGLDAAVSGDYLQWAMADPGTDELLGVVGFPRLLRGNGEVGYWTHPDARGRGLASEAVGLVLAHGFRPVESGGLGLRRVYARASVGNTASRRVLEQNGFTAYGTEHRADELGDGTVSDNVLFELLVDD